MVNKALAGLVVFLSMASAMLVFAGSASAADGTCTAVISASDTGADVVVTGTAAISVVQVHDDDGTPTLTAGDSSTYLGSAQVDGLPDEVYWDSGTQAAATAATYTVAYSGPVSDWEVYANMSGNIACDITLDEASPSPTPSATPSPTPSPTPSATPSPTPSPSDFPGWSGSAAASADDFIPIYFFMAVVGVLGIFYAAYAIIIKPWLRKK